MFQDRSVLEGTSYRSRVLVMLSFSVIICYSAIEIDLYSLYRKPPFSICCVYACAHERGLMTRKSYAVGMQTALLRNNLKAVFVAKMSRDFLPCS